MLSHLITAASLPAPLDDVEITQEVIGYMALGTVVLLLGIFLLNAILSIRTIVTKKPPNRIALFSTCGVFMFLFITNILASVFIYAITDTFNQTGVIIFSIWFALAAIMISLTVSALRKRTITENQENDHEHETEDVVQEA